MFDGSTVRYHKTNKPEQHTQMSVTTAAAQEVGGGGAKRKEEKRNVQQKGARARVCACESAAQLSTRRAVLLCENVPRQVCTGREGKGREEEVGCVYE